MAPVLLLLIFLLFVYCLCKCCDCNSSEPSSPSRCTSPRGEVHSNSREFSQRWLSEPVQSSQYRGTQSQSSRLHYRGEPIDRTFVNDIVEIFRGQRIRGYQFAVIFLSRYRHVTLNNRQSYTNNTNPTHPPDHTLENYIVARPDGFHHAEVLLLGRFSTLLARNTQCLSILLYSWLLPCQHCAEEIARVLGQYTATHHVTLVYTTTVREASENQERRNKLTMQNAGITVIKRQYSGYLASAGD